jgi:aldose sugar dehydrogenase
MTHSKRLAATIALILAGLVLASSGCVTGPRAEDSPSNDGTMLSPGPDVSDNPAADAADRLAPYTARTLAPNDADGSPVEVAEASAPDAAEPSAPDEGEASAPAAAEPSAPDEAEASTPALADSAPADVTEASAPAVDETSASEEALHPAPEDAAASVPAAAQAGAPTPKPGATSRPTNQPTSRATSQPTTQPTNEPTVQPTSQPAVEVIAVTLAKDNRIALIDPVTGRITRAVDVSKPPGAMTLTPDGHSAWFFGAQPGLASIGSFDVLSGDRRADVHFSTGDLPSAVAFSTDGTRAFVALGSGSSPGGPSTIAFMSTAGREFGRVTVGRQTPGVQVRRELSSLATVPAENGDVLYAAGEASGVVWALDSNSGAVLNEIEVGGGPTSIVVDPARQRAYVLLDTLNQVVAIDTATSGITNRLDLPARPIGAAVGSDGTVFITGGDAIGELWVIEPSATEMRSRVPIGGRPVGLAISSDSKSLYLPDSATRSLAILTSDTLQVTRTISLGSEPLSLVAVHGVPTAPQRQTAAVGAPTPAAGANPTALPKLAPTPTPLPEGARPADQLAAGAIAEPFVPGVELPVALGFAPDGRLFYNELRTGRIRVVENGTLLPDPFYQFVVADQPETGLMGLTLDPDFANNHYVYVLYTSVPDDAKETGATNGPTAVIRLTDVANKGNDPTPVLENLPSGATHNSGALRFGPDGKLYVSVGDNDHSANAQDLSTLAGKILRVNPDGSIPEDNPFVNEQGKQGAIWAYGLRNAYSFAFHPVGHALLAVENGASAGDKLDLIVRGANYGWPPARDRVRSNVNNPMAVIDPPIGPTGSNFYTGDQMPAWKNDWFYCNDKQGQLRRVHLAPGSFDRVVFEEVVKQGCTYDVITGPDGALYYSDAKGIYRIRQPDAEVLPAVKMTSAPGL